MKLKKRVDLKQSQKSNPRELPDKVTRIHIIESHSNQPEFSEGQPANRRWPLAQIAINRNAVQRRTVVPTFHVP